MDTKNQNSTPNPSPAVVKRLPRYYRYLRELITQGKMRISSGELSAMMNVTASQIRQDLNCFGGFGQQSTTSSPRSARSWALEQALMPSLWAQETWDEVSSINPCLKSAVWIFWPCSTQARVLWVAP